MLKFSPTVQEKPKFDRSKFKSGYTKTIIANQLDGAFKRFDGEFSFVYEPKGSDFGWHPSGDCLPPVSELWAKAHAALHPDVESAHHKDLSYLNKIFMVGHYWHQVIQFLIVKEGWADQSAIERIGYRAWDIDDIGWIADDPYNDNADGFKPFHYVRGQGDIAPLITDNWSGLVDIKTMNPADFKAGLAKSRFSRKYLAQINIYMSLFDLDQAMILAVDKGSSAFQEYTFVRNQELIDQIFRKWKRVGYLLDNDESPDKDDDKEYALSIGDE